VVFWTQYVPAAHATHEPPLGPLYPSLHVQLSAETLPAGESWFESGQLVHTDDPVLAAYFAVSHVSHVADPDFFLNVPKPQGSQGPPSAPVYPGSHVQSVMAVDPLGALEFAGQVKQSDAAVPPVVLRYVPAAHLAHGALPAMSLYVPSPHTEQLPGLPVYPMSHWHWNE